ncbi:MAG: DUF721 domain-containing protein [Rhodobacteraceae bacterium]|nr:DUF721 domain-containing protein [Paracoccaceae bacterium]
MPPSKGDISYRGGGRSGGFRRTGTILAARIRKAGESRGFVEARLLTHWAEIAGEDVARAARPVKVGYGRAGGLGATLTLLVNGAHAPLVQMQLPRIRDRVNAAYGYNAIARIHLAQTAPDGFTQARKAPPPARPALSESETARVCSAVFGTDDAGLKAALEKLGRNVLAKAKSERLPHADQAHIDHSVHFHCPDPRPGVCPEGERRGNDSRQCRRTGHGN